MHLYYDEFRYAVLDQGIVFEEGVPKNVSVSTDNEGQVIQAIFGSIDENGSMIVEFD